ncbi:MAG: hypothetical protein LBD57_01355, partial [Endomicrobium sp.]|uniref:hypothetical protein n=1 Tax=Candidatus Endomicrobiellum cubanum TaxID=3242325 RepID=UPI0028332DDF|nr:hypothetical protein [Endomicrobium sp.]
SIFTCRESSKGGKAFGREERVVIIKRSRASSREETFVHDEIKALSNERNISRTSLGDGNGLRVKGNANR